MDLRCALITILALSLVTCSKHDDQTTTASQKPQNIPVPSSWIHFRDGVELDGDTLYLYSNSTFRMIDFDDYSGKFILNGDSLTLNILNSKGDSDYEVDSRNGGILASLDLLKDGEYKLKHKVGSKFLFWEKYPNVETTTDTQKAYIKSESEASTSKEHENNIEHKPVSFPSAWIHVQYGDDIYVDTLILYADSTFRITQVEEDDGFFGKFIPKSDSLTLNVLYGKWESGYNIESRNGSIVASYDFFRHDDIYLKQKVGSEVLLWEKFANGSSIPECSEYSIGSHFTACKTKKKLFIMDTESGDTVYVGSPRTQAYASPAGNYLVSLGRNFTLHNRLDKTEKSYEIETFPDRFNHVIISDKDGAGVFFNYEAEGGEYFSPYGLNTETGKFVELIDVPHSMDAFITYEGFFSPSSDMYFLCARASGTEYTKSGGVVFAFNSKTFKEVWRYDFEGDLSGIGRISGVCSPDGEYLLIETQSNDLSGGGQMNEGYATFLLSSEGHVIKKYELVRREREYGFNTSLGLLYLNAYAGGTPFSGENIIRLSDGVQLLNLPNRVLYNSSTFPYSIDGFRQYLQVAPDWAKRDMNVSVINF